MTGGVSSSPSGSSIGRSGESRPILGLNLPSQRQLRTGPAAPDFFNEFLPSLRIESDDPDRPGLIPFVPFPFQQELFEKLLSGQDAVILKRRQIGISWCLAAYCFWLAAYHPATHVGIISAGQKASNEFVRKVRTVYHGLPRHLQRAYHGKNNIEFDATGSVIVAFPSTEKAGISFRFRLLVADEGAFHPYGEENYAAYRPTLDAGGQYVLASTADPMLGPSGFFHSMWQRAKRREVKYEPIFLGRFCRPDQDEAWWEETAKNFVGLPQHLDAYYPLTPADAFVGRSGLVFPQFSEERHVRLTDPMYPEDYDYLVLGIDPGGGDPTAITTWGIYKDRQTGVLRWHQPEGGEFYSRDTVGIDDLVEYVGRWQGFHRCYIDTAGGTVIMETLRRYFGEDRIWPALKDRPFGLGLYASLLESQRLTHHVSNVNSIAEYANYRWLDRTNPNTRDRYRTSTPVNDHADAKDSARYAIAGFNSVLYRTVAQNKGRTPMTLVWRTG